MSVLVITDEQRRYAISDSGRADFRSIAAYFDDGHEPIGNANLHQILRLVRWAWLTPGGPSDEWRAVMDQLDQLRY